MLTSVQSAGVTPEMNLRITQAKNYAKGSTQILKPRADITGSPKQGVSGPTKMTCILQIFFQKAPTFVSIREGYIWLFGFKTLLF